MFCLSCGSKIEKSDKFCKKCGQEQSLITTDEKMEENDLVENENKHDDVDDIENEKGITPSKDPEAVIIKKENFIKKIFKGVGTGGLIVGGGFLYVSFTILQFLFVVSAGMSMIG